MVSLIGAVSPIGSIEAERAAHGKHWLKTGFHSKTTTDRLENDANLIQTE